MLSVLCSTHLIPLKICSRCTKADWHQYFDLAAFYFVLYLHFSLRMCFWYMYLIIKQKKLLWSLRCNASFHYQYVFLIIIPTIIHLLCFLWSCLRNVFFSTEACCVVTFHVSYTYLSLLHPKKLWLILLLCFIVNQCWF